MLLGLRLNLVGRFAYCRLFVGCPFSGFGVGCGVGLWVLAFLRGWYNIGFGFVGYLVGFGLVLAFRFDLWFVFVG